MMFDPGVLIKLSQHQYNNDISYLLECSQWCAHCLDELACALAHAAVAGLGARLHTTAGAGLATWNITAAGQHKTMV
jgi:hypothetical protein